MWLWYCPCPTKPFAAVGLGVDETDGVDALPFPPLWEGIAPFPDADGIEGFDPLPDEELGALSDWTAAIACAAPSEGDLSVTEEMVADVRLEPPWRATGTTITTIQTTTANPIVAKRATDRPRHETLIVFSSSSFR